MKKSIALTYKLLISFALFGICFLYYQSSYDSYHVLDKLLIRDHRYSFYDITTLTLIFSLYLILISTWMHNCVDLNMGYMSCKYKTRKDWGLGTLKVSSRKYMTAFFIYMVIIISLNVLFYDDRQSLISLDGLLSCVSLYMVMLLMTKGQLLIAIKYSTFYSVVICFTSFVLGLLALQSKFLESLVLSRSIYHVIILLVCLMTLNKILNLMVIKIVEKKEFI